VIRMSFLEFLAGALIISLSGVMAPGPLTAVTVGKGGETPHAGALVAVGHGIVEFPLMIAIFFGFGFLFNLPYIKPAIGIAGGIYLLFMAVGMFKSVKNDIAIKNDRHSPLFSGMMLSVGNPYFLIWWATAGATLVMQSAEFGIAGLLIFMFLHWSCDLTWSWSLSALSFKGGRFFGRSFQKIVFAVSGLLLVGFSGKFVYDAVKILLSYAA
jgi:threonine/homoserine/homoserine lactone efflux protein